MSRFQSEWHRLYRPNPADASAVNSDDAPLINAQGQVRAMVLELAGPTGWAALSTVWQGIQLDLALPAPAIAVSGVDGYQLWFSLAEPLPAPQAHAFLEALRQRYLVEVTAARISLLPEVSAGAPMQARHVSTVPGQQVQADQWSAFVAPDLAPMFAQTPWLDMPPSPEGQAELLSRLRSILPDELQKALAQLQPAQALPSPSSAGASGRTEATQPGEDPRRFLLQVMNDNSVDLALRIEAAKALLSSPPTA